MNAAAWFVLLEGPPVFRAAAHVGERARAATNRGALNRRGVLQRRAGSVTALTPGLEHEALWLLLEGSARVQEHRRIDQAA